MSENCKELSIRSTAAILEAHFATSKGSVKNLRSTSLSSKLQNTFTPLRPGINTFAQFLDRAAFFSESSPAAVAALQWEVCVPTLGILKFANSKIVQKSYYSDV